MKNLPLLSAILFLTALLFATPAFAQKKRKVVKHKKTRVVHNHKTNKTHVVRHTTPKKVTNTRVVHNRNTHKTHVVKTVRVGTRVRTLPVGYKRIAVGNVNYYNHLGNFYQWNSNRRAYVVVRPPIGAVVSAVPTGYTMVAYNGLNHCVWNGVYYRPEVRNGLNVFVVARV